ncbi:MAG: hypothetical protein ABIP41_01080 [Croceibacterium sp.]
MAISAAIPQAAYAQDQSAAPAKKADQDADQGNQILVTAKTANGDWEVAGEVRNLTDKFYYTDIFDNRGSTNSIQGSPGEPRTWSVTVRRNF